MIEKLMLLFMWLYVTLDRQKSVESDVIALNDTDYNRRSKQLT